MRVFISGFGTVGRGAASLLAERSAMLEARFGEPVSLAGAMDSKSFCIRSGAGGFAEAVSRKESTGMCGPELRGGRSAEDVLAEADYDLLVECTPTNIEDGGEGLKAVRRALGDGKDVVTVNKGPLALRFSELTSLAERNGCAFRYEGSVGGAMPIINLCRECLRGQEIRSVGGIFNGTCNFILSRMDGGLPFEQALKEAQQLGYAEADPGYDIGGIDSACKVAILANSVFGRDVTVRDVSVTGIASVTEDAIAMAAGRGMVVRLIGEVSADRLEVSPRLVPRGHPLSISGTLNAALIQTDSAGPVTVTGRGAGGRETASAVLSDVMAVMESRRRARRPPGAESARPRPGRRRHQQ